MNENLGRFRHKVRGSTYELLMLGKLEHDLEPVVIYRAESGGQIWVRPTLEFFDGRFERLVDTPSTDATGEQK